jgi:hypothetical protein
MPGLGSDALDSGAMIDGQAGYGHDKCDVDGSRQTVKQCSGINGGTARKRVPRGRRSNPALSGNHAISQKIGRFQGIGQSEVGWRA